MLAPQPSAALDFALGASGATLSWDTSLKYSNAFRLKNPDDSLVNDATGASVNSDDGDRNFRRGLISNRVDVFTEADLQWSTFGLRVSGAAWYDSVYNRRNDHDAPGTTNNLDAQGPTAAYNQFAEGTRHLAGRKGELLDAFVFGGTDLGSVPLTFRVGRHTLYWGETLFLGNNGIAGTMSPIDALKAASVPGSTTKEIFRPVGQVSAQLQFTPDLSLAGYYQYQWERSVLPPAGHYFNPGDFLDDGGSCIRFAPGAAPNCGPGLGLARIGNVKARNTGQFGLQMRWTDAEHRVTYGLYANNSHAKTPSIYSGGMVPNPLFNVDPNAQALTPSTYQLLYHENIRTYAASVAGNVGAYQLSAEASMRDNMTLATDAAFNPGNGDNRGNPLYPVGKTAHLNLLAMTTLPPNFIARSSSLSAELAWNRVLSQINAAPLAARSTRDATALAVSYALSYTQVAQGLDVDVPIFLSYNLDGNSRVFGSGQGGRGAGTFSVGLRGNYLAVWNLSANYGMFFGPQGTPVINTPTGGVLSYKQTMKDRNFVSFSVSRTF